MGDWRAMADEALQGRNDRNIRNDSHKKGPIVPIVPIVPANPSRVAKLWHAKLSALDHFTSPSGWSLNRWLDTVDTAMWLYEEFASQLIRGGWSAADLFGVIPSYPGEGGLADRMGKARNLKLLDGVAHWRTPHGLRKQFPRGGGVDLAKGGLVLLWKVN